MWLSAARSAPSDLLMFGWTHPFSFLSSALSCCHVAVSLSQSVAVSDPKQVQLIQSKNASSPTSPTGPTSPAWTEKGSAPVLLNPEVGKDLFNMKPWVIPQFCLTGTNLLALLTSSVPPTCCCREWENLWVELLLQQNQCNVSGSSVFLKGTFSCVFVALEIRWMWGACTQLYDSTRSS